MADERLYDEQVKRELDAMIIYLTTKAAKTALTLDEFIQSRLLLGSTAKEIESMLLDDLTNNGRIFSEFRRAIKSTARGSINRVRDIGYFSEEGVDRNYRWSAVLVRTCPDCLERHNQVKTWEEWEDIGLPRTGSTVCRENCHCILVPEQFSALEPIKREKR
jgi:hypothetical protein